MQSPSHSEATAGADAAAATPGTAPSAAGAGNTCLDKGTVNANANANANAKRRGTVACRRCRRLRARCVHEKASPPCDSCRVAGPQVSAECSFPRRGERDLDRQFRRRPILPPGPDSASAPNAAVEIDATVAAAAAAPMAGGAGGVSNNHYHEEAGLVKAGGATSYSPDAPVAASVLNAEGGLGAATRHQRPPWDSHDTTFERQTSPEILSPKIGLQPSPKPSLSSFDPEHALPPHEEVVEGCRIFVTSYFQLGFIPKAVFLESLVRDPTSVSKFLLTCILSISARFTPSLTLRYGSARQATDYFLDVSKCMAPSEMYRPSLERIQAFFLLAISQWGNGDRDRSGMDMGVAVRMAALLKLHCEESYILDAKSTTDHVVRSESARRVFWMIQSQENLHSGYKTPAPFPLEDVTTLLPCDEADFAFGAIPAERAALAGTPPALANPQLVYSPRRCLFATLIQAHGLWGKVARRARRSDHSFNKAPPWDPHSEYSLTASELHAWEEHLPAKHAFSVWNLRGWRSESLHLAYLSVTMVLRLANIVTRRIYMDEMLLTLLGHLGQPMEPSTPTMAHTTDYTSQPYPRSAPVSSGMHRAAPPGFWMNMAYELFSNVWNLHEQIDAYFRMRAVDEGFPQILVFCVYMCGSMSSNLWRNPGLCPQLSDRAELMAQRSLEILGELHAAWPTSSRWQKGLQQIATPLPGLSPADERRTIPTPADSFESASDTPQFMPPQPMVGSNPYHTYCSNPQTVDQRQAMPEGILGEMINVLPNSSGQLARLGSRQMMAGPNDVFELELSALMHGEFQYDAVDGWQQYGVMG